MKRALLWLPAIAFVGLLALLAAGLFAPADRTVRSAMIGKPVPTFALQPIVPGKPGLASTDLGGGRPRLLNVWASWCAPCIAEAPVLLELERAGVDIVGVAVRDRPEDVAAFLARHGDAFSRIGSDPESQFQIALGAAGVPESFVIDGGGRIVLQHVGEIKPADIPDILAAIEKAR